MLRLGERFRPRFQEARCCDAKVHDPDRVGTCQGSPCRVPWAPDLRLGLLTSPSAGSLIHSLKKSLPARALPQPPSISPAPSELYPFVFFTLRAHSNDPVIRSI